MKKISYVIILTLSAMFFTCEGPQGIPGPPGFNGQDGLNADEYAALSFERTVDFQYFNDTGLQETFVNLPFDILDSDVVLVYRLEAIVTIDGIPTEAWSALPQNFFLNGTDIIQYVFNHTFADVELLIDGNFDLSTLGSEFTQDQVFRFVILPADAINGIDVSDINTVLALDNVNWME
ncbi:hypothetical protein J4050_11975 [Winogradskyella sp. DF17]|uniref:Collagen-like protein n=1 Tax=Winogradskyella pelagia TaxID=2819984 RepID=A0ABS3T404_9FLAO|nr:hypothetical protein [Winogradskyella sp. DF17]MBO3117471.1 hypothetical protein [Winogradskyella sp. DF17]